MKNKLNFTDGIIVSGMVDKVINTELQKEDIINEYKEELKEKINAMIILLGQCSDVYVEEEVKSKLVRIEQLKEILKLLEE